MGILFVGGVHGVGKTTVCSELARDHGVTHLAASTLINERRSAAITSQTKIVSDVNDSQELLIDAVHDWRIRHRFLMIDGHFSLLTSKETVTTIPKEVFEKIAPAAIVVFHDDVELIAKRLLNRDKGQYSLELLVRFQETEIAHAQYVAQELSIECIVLHVSDLTVVQAQFQRLIQAQCR